MKKIIILNGSPHKAGNTTALVDEVTKTMKEIEVEIKYYNLNNMQIRGCQGCYSCTKTGKCSLKDDMQQIYPDIESADGIIFATPVFMWQMSAQIKLAIDRLLPYLKNDHSSRLSPDKRVLFVVTFGGGVLEQYQEYFDLTGKSLAFLGFGEYKTLITGGLNGTKDILERPKVLSEAKELGEWLLSMAL